MYSSLVLQKQRGQGATQLGKKERETCALQIHKYFPLYPHGKEISEFTPCTVGCHSLAGLRGRFHPGSPRTLIVLLFRAGSATVQGR